MCDCAAGLHLAAAVGYGDLAVGTLGLAVGELAQHLAGALCANAVIDQLGVAALHADAVVGAVGAQVVVGLPCQRLHALGSVAGGMDERTIGTLDTGGVLIVAGLLGIRIGEGPPTAAIGQLVAASLEVRIRLRGGGDEALGGDVILLGLGVVEQM